MGSGEGAGYANGDGHLTGWINELCYAKLDMNPKNQPTHGPRASTQDCRTCTWGSAAPPRTLPRQQQGTQIYETCGAYLGYGLAQYGEFYKIDHVMVLGRVSKGAGGDIMLDTTKKVLQEEFPEFAGIKFHTADDNFKSGEQCIAASAASPIDGSWHCHPFAIGPRVLRPAADARI